MTGYERFRDKYKPLIRPHEMIERTHRNLHLGHHFVSRFDSIRRHLRKKLASWPDKIALSLLNDPNLSEYIGELEVEVLRHLYRFHERRILGGQFREAYFSSLEDIGLFYLYLGLPQGPVIGAVKSVMMHEIEEMYNDKDSAHKRVAIITLIDLLMLEVNQLQRVFVLYGKVIDGVEVTDEPPQVDPIYLHRQRG